MKCRGAALVVGLVVVGCGTGDDERAARAAATTFVEAVEARDGARACDELTEAAQSALEQEEQAPCEKAVLALEARRSEVADAEVWETSGRVDFEGGGTVFLDLTSDGWKVGAAACEARPGQPYECDLEA